MKLKAANLEGLTLTLELDGLDARDAAGKFLNRFKPDNYEIKRIGRKRSLDANAYAWKLIDMIAEALGEDKTTIYRATLCNVGGVSDMVAVKEEAFPRFKKGWVSKGLGWQCNGEKSKLKGFINATLIYGSSVFNTQQMSRFIDSLEQDAQQIGIDIKPKEEKQKLLNEWQD